MILALLITESSFLPSLHRFGANSPFTCCPLALKEPWLSGSTEPQVSLQPSRWACCLSASPLPHRGSTSVLEFVLIVLLPPSTLLVAAVEDSLLSVLTEGIWVGESCLSLSEPQGPHLGCRHCQRRLFLSAVAWRCDSFIHSALPPPSFHGETGLQSNG